VAGTRLVEIEISRFVTGLPLDIAPKAGALLRGNRSAAKHGIDGCAEIVSRWFILTRTSAVELSAVNKLAVGVKEIEVRRASSGVGLCDFLSFIVQHRETEQVCEFASGFGRVLWIVLDVVGGYSHKGDRFPGIVAGDSCQLFAHMNDVWAMVAEKNDHERRAAGKVLERHGLVRGDVRQGKSRGRGAEREHGGVGTCHK